MTTVSSNDARSSEKTQEQGANAHVLRNLSIPASTFKSISAAASFWRMEVDDFLVVCAWRESVLCADAIRPNSLPSELQGGQSFKQF